MKKSLLALCVSLFCGTFALAAQDNQTLKYLYHEMQVLDRDYSVIEEFPSENGNPVGMYILTEIESYDSKYIVVTIGKEITYQIQVVNIVEGEVKDGMKVDMYQGGM